MIDETAGSGVQGGAPVGNAETTEAAGGRVAFCQHCGRELTAETVRRVGSAVYCEPCLVARLEGAQPGAAAGAGGATGYGAVNAGPAAGYAGAPVPPVAGTDTPSPGLAGLLGLIPGVGAMYNGQFAKGVAHLVIFAVLVSLADNVNGIFGLFVAGWIFFQAFEAYHTAKARRDGLPLPNAFGLNDIGDRLGFGRNWPGSASRPVSSAPASEWATNPPPPGSPGGGWAASAATSGAGTNWNPNWAGYVPPTSFGATAPPSPVTGAAAGTAGSAAPSGQQQPPAGAWASQTAWNPGPYGPAYAGEPLAGVPAASGRRFPIGAAWLIGLGVLFLLSNLAPEWRIAGRWLVPLVLAGLACWLLYRRVDVLRRMAQVSGETEGLGPDAGARLACQVRGPVMLLVLALLFALQAGHVLTLGQTWPVLLVAFGALLLMERTVGRGGWYPPVGVAGAGWTANQTEPRKDGK